VPDVIRADLAVGAVLSRRSMLPGEAAAAQQGECEPGDLARGDAGAAGRGDALRSGAVRGGGEGGLGEFRSASRPEYREIFN